MAYINVADWTPDQVKDWLKGLDDCMYDYVHSFTNNKMGGQQLLNIRPYELEQLGMFSIGHQEIVLDAVENLRNFHYNLDKENLQFMALHVASAARSLHRQLAIPCDASKIETQILNDITRTIGTIKPLIGWLDRAPFHGQLQFAEICRNMLRLGLEMATIAQRDRFVEQPVEQIRGTAEKLERLANYIIQDITDPMLLQPASLNLVTLKKRESELGFNIQSSYHGIHRVTDIKYNSPAHNSGKIEDGDEIVQINYQTVVGWQYKTVLLQLRESLPDVLLTLKKRPKHTKIYGQIYMQPYRLPSKKRAMGARWGENLPSPRAGFLTVPESAFNMPLSLKPEEKATTAASSDSDSSCSDILTPTDTKETEKEIRLYYPKPRTMLQRRNTISGDELLGLKSLGSVPLWHERKTGVSGDPASPSLRDKSVSFGFGLEITPRPTTCIGLASSNGKFGAEVKDLLGETKKQQRPEVDSLVAETVAHAEEKSKPGVSKVVRFDANMKYEDYPVDEKYICNVENTILETFEPIPFADEEDDALDELRLTSDKAEDILAALDKFSKSNSPSLAEAVNNTLVARRGRLDKSHSTPAYDNSCEESDTPPAIEPRKEFLQHTPPAPPPRPRKQKDLAPMAVPPPPPKPPGLMAINAISAPAPEAPVLSFIDSSLCVPSTAFGKPPIDTPPEPVAEASELHTPTKARILTLKKKHSLISKRRNVNLKLLGTGDIQGHLYRRTKDRRGVTFWARLYFVMLDTILYGFRSKEAPKASCVIFLPGFTVSLAKEVHSKPFAFKVYHSAKTFYFAAESQDALNQWVDFIRQATLQPHPTAHFTHNADSASGGDVNTKDLFSETNSSGEETETAVMKNLCTPSPQGSKDGGWSAASKLNTTPTSSSSSTKHDRRYLGSLRKLTKGTLPFKSSSSSEKKPSSDIPVPTDQYRSYRKVPGGSFGIQIGTNTPGYNLYPYNMQVGVNSGCASPLMEQSAVQLSSSHSSIISTSDASSLCLGPPSSPAPIPKPAAPPILNAVGSTSHHHHHHHHEHSFDSPSKGIKKFPYNFIHASNPNLVEFDFQTSKTLDYSLPKINPSNSWESHPNIQGFVTLKDLMLRKQEEEAQEMYNNRVLLGVEKKDERKRNAQRRLDGKQQAENNGAQQPTVGGKVSKTQSRSLPKTPDYEISFKPDDENIKRTRTKEGLKLRDFGYELISGDEPLGGVTTSRQNSNTSTISCMDQFQQQQDSHSWTSAMKTRHIIKSQQFLLSTHKSKKHSSNSCSSTSSADFASNGCAGDKRAGSFKKKGKLDAVKTSGERIFKQSSSGMTMTLPLNKKANHGMDVPSVQGGGGIKKSHTYNNDLKEKTGTGGKYEAHRKNSAPMPILAKLTFSSNSASASTSNNSSSSNNNNNNVNCSNKIAKEKRLLGSPLLHRTIFGSNHQHQAPSGGISIPATPPCMGREYDREIFSQVIFPKVPSHHHSENVAKFRKLSASNASITAPDVVAPPPPIPTQPPPHHQPLYEREGSVKSATPSSNAATPEYPNMECPPVFEPEIYSLTDPNACSLTLLLRRKNSGSCADEK